jgi:hypothetical protein
MLVAAVGAIAGCITQEELNSSYIVPSAFDPSVAPGRRGCCERGGTTGFSAQDAVEGMGAVACA